MVKKRGMGLLEVVVATAIVVSLCATLWLVVGPSARRKALETKTFSDLRQIGVAIGLYRADYDDRLPPTMQALEQHTPTLPRVPKGTAWWPGCGGGEASYSYTRHYAMVDRYSTQKPLFPWDEARNPVVKVPFLCRIPGSRERFGFVTNTGRVYWRTREVKKVPGVRIDASVGWFDQWEEWQEAFANGH